MQEVLARSPVAARASARSMVALSVISIVGSDGVFRGTLGLPSGEVREVVGTSCAEVAGALALVVALKARAAESTVAEPEPPAMPPQGVGTTSQTSATPATPASTTSGIATSASSATAAASATAASPERPSTIRAEPRAPRRTPPGAVPSSMRLSIKSLRFSSPALSPTRWSFGAGAVAAFGPAPVGLFGAGLFAEYQSRSSIPHSVLLGAEAAPYATASVQAATARYRWGASRAAACIQTLRFDASSALWLCAEVVGGLAVVTGQASGPITHSRTAREAWLSAGPAARFRVELSASYSLELAAGAGIPVIRHRTVFYEPKLVLHETGNLAGFLALQLGRHSGG